MATMTRDEHLAWCKTRALEYLNRGEAANAVASLGSDLTKHPGTDFFGPEIMMVGMLYAKNEDIAGLRRWIEGFR
jgi:hypothetical protein